MPDERVPDADPRVDAAAEGAAALDRGAVVTLRRDVRLWQAALWPGGFAEGSARLGAALRLSLPAPGASAIGAAGRLFRAAPLVWGLLDPPREPDDGPPAALRGIDPEAGAVAELGPGLARLTVEGPAGAELLARAIPLDLRPAAFGPGALARTGWRGAEVTLLRPEAGGFVLLVPLSLAEDMAALLRRHARQFA